MSTPTRTFLQLVQEVADGIGVRESGTLTTSSTTQLTAANYPYKTGWSLADASKYANAEVYTTSGVAPTPNPNGIKTYAPSTGIFDTTFTYTLAPEATSTFDLYLRGVGVQQIKDAVNKALRERAYLTHWPMTLVTDGDMSSSSTGYYTASNATLSKITTQAGTFYNQRSLRVVSTADGGTCRAEDIQAPDPDNYRTYVVNALTAAIVGTCTLTAYDVTNSATIQTETYDKSGWGYINFTFTLPATCEKFRIYLGGTLNGDDTYWNFLSVLPVGATSIVLPDWVRQDAQIRNLWRTPIGTPSPLGPLGKEVTWFKPFQNLSNPNNSMRVDFFPSISGPVWMEAYKFFDELSADTDTTFANRSWIVLAAQVNLLSRLIQRPKSEVTVGWDEQYRRLAARLKRLDRTYMPPSVRLQMSEPF